MALVLLLLALFLELAEIASGQSNGAVRLADGIFPSQGRVEVYLNGRWGTVCDDTWDLNDGTVVCRQLGYINATVVTVGAADGEGEGPINLKGLECNGNESNITLCPTNVYPRRCDHSDDAGVKCFPDDVQDQGLSNGAIAAIVFVPFLLIIIAIMVVIVIMLYFTLTYDKDAKEKAEKGYQEKRFLKGIKLKDSKKRSARSRRKSGDSHVSERIPRNALGEGKSHPWQEDLGADSELIVDEEMFKVVQEEESHGEVRQRVVSAINPIVMKIDAEVQEDSTASSNNKSEVPSRYQKKTMVMSDEEIDQQFNFAVDEDDDDINPYEEIDFED